MTAPSAAMWCARRAAERIDLRKAEAVLGHPLTGGQLGFICWTTDSSIDLPGVAQRFADRVLVITAGPRTVWGWTVAAPGSVADAAPLGEDVHLAVGSVQPGSSGFRTTHLQALRARRIAELAERPAPSVTVFGDVALVDLLSQDLDAARAYVRAELGDLARADAKSSAERAALLAFLSAQGSLKAAADALGVHRNTVLQRVRRAEHRLGGPVTARLAEVHAALQLCDVLAASLFHEK
ncbi:PucR family transcriptional regulator [Mycobacterium sp. NPDC003323]